MPCSQPASYRGCRCLGSQQPCLFACLPELTGQPSWLPWRSAGKYVGSVFVYCFFCATGWPSWLPQWSAGDELWQQVVGQCPQLAAAAAAAAGGGGGGAPAYAARLAWPSPCCPWEDAAVLGRHGRLDVQLGGSCGPTTDGAVWFNYPVAVVVKTSQDNLEGFCVGLQCLGCWEAGSWAAVKCMDGGT